MLPRLLAALARQAPVADTRVVACFLLDGCQDRSAAIVAGFARRASIEIVMKQVARDDRPSAGLARRRAMALGEAALAGERHAALLTTDADSEPADDWIAANVRALACADVAAGRIDRLPEPDGDPLADALQDRIEAYLDRLHTLRRRLDPVPWEAERTHGFTSGASLGFRADAYRRLGGFADRPAGEDALIVDVAHRLGLTVRRDAAIVVRTSSRASGRALGGLASHLGELRQRRLLPTMIHPADAAWRYARQGDARAGYRALRGGGSPIPLAAALHLDPRQVSQALDETGNAEAFAALVVPLAPGGERVVPLDDAERALARLELRLTAQAA